MRYASLAALVLAGALSAAIAHAEISDGKVKIGVLTDLGGPYEQNSGNGSTEAARIAAEEFGNKINGKPIEIIAADHQNKPDVGSAIARRWFDLEQVDAITDLVNSAVAFAALDVARAKNRTLLLTSAGSADLTGKACAPDNSVHWVYDTYQMGNAIGRAVPQLGKTWFFVAADYTFGHALQESTAGAVTRYGGKVAGSVFHPLGASDFSSFILQAQSSKADVVAIANGGDDAINAVKSAREFGLVAGGQKVVPLGLDSLPAIRSTGLDLAQGMMYVTPALPDLNEETKAFTAKFLERRKVAPSTFQLGTYSAVRSYLKAIEATNSDDPKTVIAKMRATPVNDAFAQGGVLRPDGRMVHDVYLVQIKSPAESKGEWDLIKRISTIPGDQAFRPLAEGGCPLL